MVRRDDVPWTEVQKLNAQGWSYRQLAEKFGVSSSAIGRRAVQECAEVFDAVDQQVLRGFSPGELEQLRSFHQRMLDNLRQIGGDCPPCCPAHSPFSNGKE